MTDTPIPTTPWHFLFWSLKRAFWPLLLVLLVSIICGILDRGQVYALSRIVEALLTATPDNFWTATLHATIIFFSVKLGLFILWRGVGFIYVYYEIHLHTLIKQRLFDNLLQQSAQFFQDHLAGKLGHKINQLADRTMELLGNLYFNFLPTGLALIMTLLLLSYAHSGLGLVFGLWTVAVVGIAYLFARRINRYSYEYSEARTETSGNIHDTISGSAMVKSFSAEEYESERLSGMIGIERSLGHRFKFLVQWSATSQAGATQIITALIIIQALYYVQQGSLSPANFVLAATLILEIGNKVRDLANHLNAFFDQTGTMRNSLQTLMEAPRVPNRPDATNLQATQGAITFDAVAFAYGTREPLFDNLTLHIPAGQKLGLVGASGAGKTSLISLLLRTYDPQAGAVRLDGVDIRTYTQESVRQQIAVIPQEPALFHRSLADNIRYGQPQADQAAIQQAATAAYADDFIRALPHGYDSLVGERGVKLSGGQRQRIAIARAILRNAPILVLDEATSALDSESEQIIQHALRQAMVNKTVLAIAHRLSTLRQMDKIIVLDKGRIIESGSHQALLANHGVYAKLWSLQSGDFLTP